MLQTHEGPSLAGLSTIAAHLVRQANQEHLLGSTAEEKALVQQWLEYRVTRLESQASKEDARALLKVHACTRTHMRVAHGSDLFPGRFSSSQNTRRLRGARSRAHGDVVACPVTAASASLILWLFPMCVSGLERIPGGQSLPGRAPPHAG